MKKCFRDRTKFEDNKELQEMKYEEQFKPVLSELAAGQKQEKKTSRDIKQNNRKPIKTITLINLTTFSAN